jgi:hypothetical protein
MFIGGDIEHGQPKLGYKRISHEGNGDIVMGEAEEPGLGKGKKKALVEEEGGVEGLVLIEGMEVSMEQMVRQCCEVLCDQVDESSF